MTIEQLIIAASILIFVAYFFGYWRGAKYTMKLYNEKLDSLNR